MAMSVSVSLCVFLSITIGYIDHTLVQIKQENYICRYLPSNGVITKIVLSDIDLLSEGIEILPQWQATTHVRLIFKTRPSHSGKQPLMFD